MAQSTTSYLKRFAILVLDIEEKRKLCDELYKQAEQLAVTKLIIVEGEILRINKLREMLREVIDKMQSLKQASDRAEADGLLSEIEGILSDIEWELVDDIKNSLIAKTDSQNKIIQDYETQLAEWQKLSGEIESALNDAKKARAPSRQYEIEFTRFQAQVDQAARAFDEFDFALLQKLLSDLQKSPPKQSAEYVNDIRKYVEMSQQFVRQADLLLLRAPIDLYKRFPYTVLLRTPSEPGTHGINIQGASTIVRQDRDEISEILKQITGTISADARSGFVLNNESSSINIGLAKAPPSENSGGEAAANAFTENVRGFEFDAEPTGTPFANNNELLTDVGDLMFRLLMPEQMQTYLHENSCSITITTNDLELPWELMSYKNTFLCLERPISRMPMGHAFPRTPQPIRPKTKLRFLLIYSDPKENLPGAQQEVEIIEKSLNEKWRDYIEVETIRRKDASGRELNKILRKGSFDVIHYAGHAYFDRNDADLSGLLLHDDEHFLAQKIRRLTEGRPLVFLNACESAQTANEKKLDPEHLYLQKPAEGLASAFIYGGALGCIGSLWSIYDAPAAYFAVSFYNYVLMGHMIGEAMRRARCEIKEKYPNQITWAAFVLYGDPTFRL
jgi:hypothetical protein